VADCWEAFLASAKPLFASVGLCSTIASVAARVSALTEHVPFRFVCEQRFRSSGRSGRISGDGRGLTDSTPICRHFRRRPIQNRLQHPIWILVAPPSGRHNWVVFRRSSNFDRNTKNPYAIPSQLWHSAGASREFVAGSDLRNRMGADFLRSATLYHYKLQGHSLRPIPAPGIWAIAAGASRTQHFKLDSRYPWFENQINAGIAANFGPGVTCASLDSRIVPPHWSYLQQLFPRETVRHHSGSFIDSRRDYCSQHWATSTDLRQGSSATTRLRTTALCSSACASKPTWIAIYV